MSYEYSIVEPEPLTVQATGSAAPLIVSLLRISAQTISKKCSSNKNCRDTSGLIENDQKQTYPFIQY